LSVFGPQDFACLRKVASAKAGEPCICLPARSRFGEGRDIFEQPGQNCFFSQLLNPFGLLGPLDDGRFGSLFEDRSSIDHFNPSSLAACLRTQRSLRPFKKGAGIAKEMDLTVGTAAAVTLCSDMLRDFHLLLAKGATFLDQRVLFGSKLWHKRILSNRREIVKQGQGSQRPFNRVSS
jgi:hypothetical protein